MSSNQTPGMEEATPKSVVVRVLETFIASVEAVDGYQDVAARLRDTLLGKGSRSETTLKAALFGNDES